MQTADDHHRVAVLASILQDKGLLNNTDVARLTLRPNGAVLTNPSPAVVAAAAVPERPASKSQASEVPADTKKGWPVSFYGTLVLTAGFNDANFNYEDIPMIATKQGSDPISSDAKNFYETPR